MALKFKTRGASEDALTKLLQLSQYYQQATEKKASREFDSLSKLISATNDYDDMQNLRQRLVQADEDFDNMGYDEDGDILLQLYDSKYDVMQKGQEAYDALSSMDFEIKGTESFDKKRKEILDQDWSEVNQNLRQLFVYQSQLEAAKGTRFKGSKELDPAMLQTTVSQYQSFYSNKLSLLARTGAFDIPDENIQAFDEQFGVQLMSLSPADFNKTMGQHQNYVQGLYANAESEANRYYDKMVKAENTGGESVDFEIAGLDIGEVLSSEEWRTRYNEKAELAKNLNERHKQFYGSYFSEDNRFIKGFKEEDPFKAKVLSLKKEKEKEAIEQERVELEPGLTITQDVRDSVPGGEISVAEPEIKKDLIQSGLFKVYKKGDISESIKQIDYYKKEDGSKIDVTSYDENRNIYKDINGKEYSQDDLVISSDSLNDYRPKIKKANGDYYFFNPTKNKFTKWASKGLGFDNQSFEKVNGRDVPVVYLKTEYGEGIVMEGKTIKGRVTEKLLYLNGKWKHLKLEKGKWKFINK